MFYSNDQNTTDIQIIYNSYTLNFILLKFKLVIEKIILSLIKSRNVFLIFRAMTCFMVLCTIKLDLLEIFNFSIF